MKKILACFVVLTLLLSGCRSNEQKNEGTQINLSDNKITVDGQEITSDATQAVYSANDIVFYLAGQDFTYGEGEKQDEHEQSEADAHTVVHITKPGRYVLSGTLSLGQIAIDLGEDAETDPNAVVTLILNNVDITCKVAPAIIFYNVYECAEKDEESAKMDVDTKSAGANVIIADNTINNINGSYVAKIYKPDSVILNEEKSEVEDANKLHKYDGAFYSKMSMNITGEKTGNGVLNINAENEGLGSELHLTINGGIIHINSGNDGINTNEDGVSVTTINGGKLNILCNGKTGEGDGIDSNGWLIINDGFVNSFACSTSGDAGIDSDKGIYINGGHVTATGNMLDRIAGGAQTYVVFNFASRQNGDTTYTLKNSKGDVVGEYSPKNAFTYLIVANNELAPDDYVFFKGTTQLTGVKSQNMQGMIPNGQRPQMTNGELASPPEPNQNAQAPQMPGGEPPKGERPEFPQGEMPNGERPQMPGSMPSSNIEGEASTIFTILKGGNQFVGIAPVAP